MTSINNNIPTRTFVPTTTQQPTNTNTTTSAGGASDTGSSVPTPKSSVVYTAKVPNTSDPMNSELSKLEQAVKDAEAKVKELETKLANLQKECDKEKVDFHKADDLYQTLYSSDSEYRNQLLDEAEASVRKEHSEYMSKMKEIDSLKKQLELAKTVLEGAKANLELYKSQQLTTPSGMVPTFTYGAPTATTANVPYYPTGT